LVLLLHRHFVEDRNCLDDRSMRQSIRTVSKQNPGNHSGVRVLPPLLLLLLLQRMRICGHCDIFLPLLHRTASYHFTPTYHAWGKPLRRSTKSNPGMVGIAAHGTKRRWLVRGKLASRILQHASWRNCGTKQQSGGGP